MSLPLQKQSSIYSLALAFLAVTLLPVSVRAEEASKAAAEEKPASTSPWGFSLSTYLWLPGLDADITAGGHSSSIDVTFIDIANKSRRFPLGFNGHFEAHYERFAFYLDGNYMNLKMKPAADRISEGVNVEMGIMDYGLMYRIFGATPAEMSGLQGKKRANVLEVYAGARTIWLGSSVHFSGPFGLLERTPTVGTSYTSPIIGGRIMVDFSPHWFMMMDGNIGGFGAQSVDLTAGGLGTLGYRTTFFGVPGSVEAGYKVLHYNVDKDGPTAAKVTLNGPYLGLTGEF